MNQFLKAVLLVGLSTQSKSFSWRSERQIDVTITPPIDITVSPTLGPPGPNPDNSNNTGPISQLQPGAKVTLASGQTYQVASSNFGSGPYDSGEFSYWIFTANQCVLSATCPCVDIPPAWNCFDNYLKVKTGLLYDVQRFCGGNKPGQPIFSDSGEITINFRGSFRTTATGFTCFVTCTGYGRNATTPPNVNCPPTN